MKKVVGGFEPTIFWFHLVFETENLSETVSVLT